MRTSIAKICPDWPNSACCQIVAKGGKAEVSPMGRIASDQRFSVCVACLASLDKLPTLDSRNFGDLGQ